MRAGETGAAAQGLAASGGAKRPPSARCTRLLRALPRVRRQPPGLQPPAAAPSPCARTPHRASQQVTLHTCAAELAAWIRTTRGKSAAAAATAGGPGLSHAGVLYVSESEGRCARPPGVKCTVIVSQRRPAALGQVKGPVPLQAEAAGAPAGEKKQVQRRRRRQRDHRPPSPGRAARTAPARRLSSPWGRRRPPRPPPPRRPPRCRRRRRRRACSLGTCTCGRCRRCRMQV